MASETAKALLCANLGFTVSTAPAAVMLLIENDLDTAAADLERIGIEIDEDAAADRNLLVMFAQWLYQKRKTGEGRPPMLKIQINDRKVAKATEGSA
ncbi:MAG: hypothetical protein IJH47_04255 [Oscillospiraceae bacterium]|nr:hypothetical protein [Oscillospiraceae bacterium]